VVSATSNKFPVYQTQYKTSQMRLRRERSLDATKSDVVISQAMNRPGSMTILGSISFGLNFEKSEDIDSRETRQKREGDEMPELSGKWKRTVENANRGNRKGKGRGLQTPYQCTQLGPA